MQQVITQTSLIRNSNITNDLGYKFSNPIVGGGRLNGMFYILISISGFTVTIVILMAILWTRKYRTLIHTIRDLQGVEGLSGRAPQSNPPSRSPLTLRKCLGHEVSCFNTSGLGLQHIIKAGREGVYYKAKVTRGTCKGHFIVTCKIIKEGATHRRVAREVSVMRKLGIHKNVLQLLDWNITQAPYMLILESVSSGTLRSFLQVNQDQLSRDSQLQHFFTTAAYHIAHAMRHLCSKMVVYCDLALRNIMVNHFPREVKLAVWTGPRPDSQKEPSQQLQSGPHAKCAPALVSPRVLRMYAHMTGPYHILTWRLQSWWCAMFALDKGTQSQRHVGQRYCRRLGTVGWSQTLKGPPSTT
ncbi:fibroblast growth factor receptor 4-like isoform X2 [Oncorhynchus keta]|uniref:fibroblast growth factor receptor 4-like isoform X2 n=1 Tax=Oncorhynchus keta TaxID=8018 RepID=UPI0015FB5A72|nr:fibroblast growth factor receptor 4-like isoform X2 [Oncorhynchus keta]